jgi:leukotriene-A4 hydrolase
LHGEGIQLPVEMEYDMTLAEEAYALAERWDASRSIVDVAQLDFEADDITRLSAMQIGAFYYCSSSLHTC